MSDHKRFYNGPRCETCDEPSALCSRCLEGCCPGTSEVVDGLVVCVDCRPHPADPNELVFLTPGLPGIRRGDLPRLADFLDGLLNDGR